MENAKLTLGLASLLTMPMNPATPFAAEKLKNHLLRVLLKKAVADAKTHNREDNPEKLQRTPPRFGAEDHPDSFGAVVDTDIGRKAYERASDVRKARR